MWNLPLSIGGRGTFKHFHDSENKMSDSDSAKLCKEMLESVKGWRVLSSTELSDCNYMLEITDARWLVWHICSCSVDKYV